MHTSEMKYNTGMSDLTLQWIKLAPNGSPSQNVLKSDLKNPGIVPFGANLTHIGSKSDLPVT